MTAPVTRVKETFRRAEIVKYTWCVKPAKHMPIVAIMNRTGGTTMTPIHVSLSRRTATRVKVPSAFLVCSLLLPVIQCGLNTRSRDLFLQSDRILLILVTFVLLKSDKLYLLNEGI